MLLAGYSSGCCSLAIVRGVARWLLFGVLLAIVLGYSLQEMALQVFLFLFSVLFLSFFFFLAGVRGGRGAGWG